MRKTINTLALIFFIWLVLDALNIPLMLLKFLIIGELPYSKIEVDPVMMLAILTAVATIVIFEVLARNVSSVRRFREQLLNFATKRRLAREA